MIVEIVATSAGLAMLAFYSTGRDLLSPTFVCSVMYLVTALVAASNGCWGVEIGFDTLILVSAAILAVGLGEATARLWISTLKTRKISPTRHIVQADLSVSPRAAAILSMICAGALVVYAAETARLAASGGTAGDWMTMLGAARSERNSGHYVSIVAGHAYLISQAAAAVCAYVYIDARPASRGTQRGQTWILLPPVFIFALTTLLTTGRTQILYLLVAVSVMVALSSEQERRTSSSGRRVVRFVVLSGLAYVGAFLTVGWLRIGDVQTSNENSVGLYVGSSLPALDLYLRLPREGSQIWGERTMFGLYSLLRRLGFDVPDLDAPLEFVQFPTGEMTNIYTPLRRYVEDFGFAGTVSIMFLIGFGFCLALMHARARRSAFTTIVFSLCFPPLVEIAIEERVFMNLVSAGTLYLVCYVFIICRLNQRVSRSFPLGGSAYAKGNRS